MQIEKRWLEISPYWDSNITRMSNTKLAQEFEPFKLESLTFTRVNSWPSVEMYAEHILSPQEIVGIGNLLEKLIQVPVRILEWRGTELTYVVELPAMKGREREYGYSFSEMKKAWGI